MATILVIDPSRSMRSTLKERLEHEGYTVKVSEDIISGMALYANQHFDLLICGQPDSPLRTSTPWIRLSNDTSPENILLSQEQGAIDFVAKPINMNNLLDAVRKGLEASIEQKAQISVKSDNEIQSRTSNNKFAPPMVGDSKVMLHLKSMIDKIAPTNACVLIMGSTGTGKELVAKWIHEKSNRSNGPFVDVNCAAIPSELIESELFGHEKGAFTSAIRQHKGKFEVANKGTLFLDEIGDMSLSAQAKVLRVLQEKKVTRVGSDSYIDVDMRVIAATNKNIPEEISKGNFREDLFHRLSVITINVPCLADRIDDIPSLVDAFLEHFCDYYKTPKKSIDSDAIALLKNMPWTGNIRELRNVVERLVILCDENITNEDVKMYVHGLQ